MEERQCVICPRSIYRRRRHILDDSMPDRQPQLAEYIREHALIHVSSGIILMYGNVWAYFTFQSFYYLCAKN